MDMLKAFIVSNLAQLTEKIDKNNTVGSKYAIINTIIIIPQ